MFAISALLPAALKALKCFVRHGQHLHRLWLGTRFHQLFLLDFYHLYRCCWLGCIIQENLLALASFSRGLYHTVNKDTALAGRRNNGTIEDYERKVSAGIVEVEHQRRIGRLGCRDKACVKHFTLFEDAQKAESTETDFLCMRGLFSMSIPF